MRLELTDFCFFRIFFVCMFIKRKSSGPKLFLLLFSITHQHQHNHTTSQPFCCDFIFLRYQCTPNDHHSSAPRYGQAFDANPSKVYIFSESLIIVDYGGIFINIKKKKRFPNIARYFSKYRGSLIKFVYGRI